MYKLQGASLRAAEWIQLAFVSMFALAAWLRPLERARGVRVAILALMAIATIVAARLSSHWVSPLASSIIRDWLPAALLLVPYWQVGQFFAGANPATEERLANFDRAFFRWLGIRPAQARISTALAAYFQLAYLMVYPLVPLALVALYETGMRSKVDFYWLVVLLTTYLAFALTPFIRALPPRVLPGYDTFRMPPTWVGSLNRGILDGASIQAITCPSGHVASSMAGALALLRLEPWVGAIFLWAALSIAVATVLGGYHYVADVLLAVLIAVLIFAATFCI
jgi:membrane-associated phospholipid phosphatase